MFKSASMAAVKSFRQFWDRKSKWEVLGSIPAADASCVNCSSKYAILGSYNEFAHVNFKLGLELLSLNRCPLKYIFNNEQINPL